MVVGTKEPTASRPAYVEVTPTDGRCSFITILFKMTSKKNENKAMSLTVTEGLTVTILPSSDHEFLMTTQEVAHGYGTSDYVIRRSKADHQQELIEGKHFVTAVTFSNGDTTNCYGKNAAVSFSHGETAAALKAAGIPHNAVLWTKRGIVRLGFFIKSERARLFRDWAEELIIRVDERRDLFNQPVPTKKLPAPRKTNANRLTPARMVDILADVCMIEDKALRIRLTNKLIGGQA